MNKFILSMIVLFSGLTYSQSKKISWPEQMQKLNTTLVNAYPFFYSKREFKSKDNKQVIEKALEELRKNIHAVPLESGKDLLGSEPLIVGSVNRMEKVVSEAQDYFKKGELERSQALVKVAIHKCVACHTAHPMGQQFQNFNKEMINIKLPAADRVVGLVAIRQFTGALQVLEEAIPTVLNKEESKELIKLYLLISLRSLNDKDKTIKFLNSIVENKKVKSADKEQYQDWIKSIQENKDVEVNAATDFVKTLKLSQTLHQSLSKKLSKNEKAQAYFNLGQAYNNLEFEFLLDLPRLYFQACVDLNPEKSILEQCKSAYKVVMPGI